MYQCVTFLGSYGLKGVAVYCFSGQVEEAKLGQMTGET